MKKKVYKIVLFISIIFITLTVKANSINEIEMNIYLDKGGNAIVEETWDATLNQGTEGYRPFSKLASRSITNFVVSDDSGRTYEALERWNTSLSFSEKSYKSGINYTNDGLELCWGISKYGNRKYTLKYKINNLVTQYTDKQGIYFNFLNLDQEIDKVKITIHADFLMSLDNTRIWSFGNDGTINFNEGTIVMESEDGFYSNQYAVILVRFNENNFTNLTSVDKSFDDIYDEAFIDVDIEEEEEKTEPNAISNKVSSFIMRNNEKGFFGKVINFFTYFFLAVIMILAVLLFFILLPIFLFIAIPFPLSFISVFIYVVFVYYVIVNIKGKTLFGRSVPNKYTTRVSFSGDKKTPSYKNVDYYRDIPCDKDLYIMYWICYQYDIVDENDLRKGIIGAIILKWVRDNKVTIRQTKKSYEIELNKEIVIEDHLEKQLYDLLKKAASDNMILEKKEFQKWSKNNYNSIRDWFDKILYVGEYRLVDKKYIVDRHVLDSVKELAINIKGFKRFLLEFSEIGDRSSIEVKTWEEYLIFAELLGIAKKVRKELKELYPEVNFDVVNDVDFDFIDIFAAACYEGMTSGYNIEYARTHPSYSDHDYGGHDSFSGGGGSSFSSGGGSSGGSSGGGFR